MFMQFESIDNTKLLLLSSEIIGLSVCNTDDNPYCYIHTSCGAQFRVRGFITDIAQQIKDEVQGDTLLMKSFNEVANKVENAAELNDDLVKQANYYKNELQLAEKNKSLLAQTILKLREEIKTLHAGNARWDKRYKVIQNIHKLQSLHGNWKANDYMNGSFNALELVMSILQNRPVKYRWITEPDNKRNSAPVSDDNDMA